MSKRIPLTDLPRDVPSGLQRSLPLVTLAWRTLRAEHKRQAAAAQSREEQVSRTLQTLGDVGEQNWRLRRSLAAAASASDGDQKSERWGEQLAISERLDQILSAGGLTVLAPEGQPYVGEIVHLFDNVAQRPDATCSVPKVAEILAPAILYQDELLRMGKAVIAVPTPDRPSVNGSPDDGVPTA